MLTQCRGIDDNALAQRVLLGEDQPTYHYVEPDALINPTKKESVPRWCSPPVIGTLILTVALGIGATALVLVSKEDGDNNSSIKTGASTALSAGIPPGLIAPFILATYGTPVCALKRGVLNDPLPIDAPMDGVDWMETRWETFQTFILPLRMLRPTLKANDSS